MLKLGVGFVVKNDKPDHSTNFNWSD